MAQELDNFSDKPGNGVVGQNEWLLKVQNSNFLMPANILPGISEIIIWMPVIEVYRRKTSDGQIVYSLEKALWIERKTGEFERHEWDENLGAIIDKSHIYFKSEIRRAAETFIKSLPHPILKSIEVDYQLYTPGISETLRVIFAAFNSIVKLGNYREPVRFDNQNFYVM